MALNWMVFNGGNVTNAALVTNANWFAKMFQSKWIKSYKWIYSFFPVQYSARQYFTDDNSSKTTYVGLKLRCYCQLGRTQINSSKIIMQFYN